MTSYIILKKLFSFQINKFAINKLKIENQKMSATKRKVVQILKRTSNERTKIKTCRLCLQFGSNEIFANEGNMYIAADIEFTLGIKISKEDGGPHYLCSSCESTVEAAARLKRLAHITQWTLQKETEILAEDEPTHIVAEDEPTHIVAEEEESTMLESFDIEVETSDRDSSPVTKKRVVRQRQWRCKKCAKKFDTQENFDAHKQQPCRRPRRPPLRGPKNFMCDICGDKFIAGFKLKQHFTEYHSDKWYECAWCPHRVRKRAALVYHLRIHTGERPLKCPHCPATFTTASNLSTHRYRHFPPRHRCDQCEKVFANKQCLNNHIKTKHSDVKENPCPSCDKVFATRKVLRRHEIRMHNSPKQRGGSMPTYLRLQMEAGKNT